MSYTFVKSLEPPVQSAPSYELIRSEGTNPIKLGSSIQAEMFLVSLPPDTTYSTWRNFSFTKIILISYIYNGYGQYALVCGSLKDTTQNLNPLCFYNRDNRTNVYTLAMSKASGLIDSKTGHSINYVVDGSSGYSGYPADSVPHIDVIHDNDYNTALQKALDAFNDGIWTPSSDPYIQGGISETGGGDGNFDDTTDIIPIPPLPTESVSDTGFVNIYNPTLTQLKALATYMWTNPAFDLTNWKALVANPLDSIISLSIVPVAVPDGGTKTITVGNVSTNVSMTQAATNYIELNCGSITIEKYWGCYLDYSPYTKISLYLPYIGYNTLNIDEIMGNSLQVVYHIDIFTGGCVAFVVCGGSVLYSFPGNIAYDIPVTGADYSRVISGIVGAVSQGVTAIASGGLTAPLAVGTVASMATTVISSKPSINKGGGISGNVGILGVQKPYVEIIRPRQALPQNQNVLQGYPSLIYSRLGDLSGYTEVENINLENVNATDEEKTEIFNLLNTGVIL